MVIDPIMDDRDFLFRDIQMAHEVSLCCRRYGDHVCCFSDASSVERQTHSADRAFFGKRERESDEIVDGHDAPMVQPWNPACKMLVWQVHGLPEEREVPRKQNTLPNRLVSTR